MCSRPQLSDLTYTGGTGPCGPITIFFSNVIQSQYTSLNIKFGLIRTFHVLKTPVYRFDLYGTNQLTKLTYTGGTGPCGPMTIIFGSFIQSQYTSLNIKFGVNRTFHMLKTSVYRFDLYGRYRTLWTDDDYFWQCYLEFVYKPKYHIWCDSDVPCAQDPSLPI